jgi:hypothetical protein
VKRRSCSDPRLVYKAAPRRGGFCLSFSQTIFWLEIGARLLSVVIQEPVQAPQVAQVYLLIAVDIGDLERVRKGDRAG